jgi:predicted CopG family antitoxin
VCVLPQKGQKATTVPDRVYEKLQAIAEKKEDSIAGLVTKLADHVDFLFLVKTIDEEQTKEVLQQAYHAIDAIIDFVNFFSMEQKEDFLHRTLLGKERLLNEEWFEKNMPAQKAIEVKDQVTRLLYLIPELRAEKEKLGRVLYKISPEKISSYPTVFIKRESVFLRADLATRWEFGAELFLSWVDACFGVDFERVRKIIDSLILLRDKGLDLEWTINVLNRAYEGLLKLKKTFGTKSLLEEDTKTRLMRKIEEWEKTSDKTPTS